jgi:hypothetical protein
MFKVSYLFSACLIISSLTHPAVAPQPAPVKPEQVEAAQPAPKAKKKDGKKKAGNKQKAQKDAGKYKKKPKAKHKKGKKQQEGPAAVEIKQTDAKANPKVDVSGATRSVACSNDIAQKDLGYSKFFVTYHPTLFTLTVNGKTLDLESEKAIPVGADNKLVIKYYCEFKDGYRKSSHIYTYQLKPETNAVAIHFNWKNDQRITLDAPGATLLSHDKVNFD